MEAEKTIFVSCPELTWDKVKRFLFLVKTRQEAGCKVTVITKNPQNALYGSSEFVRELCEGNAAGRYFCDFKG